MRGITIIRAAAVFCGAALLAIAGAAALAVYLNKAPACAPRFTEGIAVRPDGSVLVDVRPGESAVSVGGRLAEASIIKSALFWQILSRLQKEYLKAGVYRVEIPSTALAIYRIFSDGVESLISVTVPEGSTLKKTAAIWGEAGVTSPEDFLSAACDPALLDRYRIPAAAAVSAAGAAAGGAASGAGRSFEGFLFPDTYRVPPLYPAEKIITLMADTFFRRLQEAGIDYAALTPEEVYRTVTLASIVEREYRVAEEAPVIAGVFQNRLDKKMRLESCATVEYVITEIEGRPHPRRLWESDTRIKNPYNTYVTQGLPPGPIANPGLTALKAAFFPQSNEYLFFRLIDARAGKHYFSRDFDSHIKAAALLVKG